MTPYRNNILIPAAGLLLAAGLSSCHAPASSVATDNAPGKVELPVIGSTVQAMPKAIVYKMSRADCADRVPITLTADGKGVFSFPAPSDLGESQKPIDLGGGWWLDRRGLQPTSVFTTYTYEQYRALPQTPSIAELMAHIDPTVRITRMVLLPLDAAEAAADPARARAFTQGGLSNGIELLDIEK